MMERKFTDDEIIKALNCCGSENCRGCPYWDYKCHGGNQMIRDALDLINRQKAEIERLADRNHKCIYLSDDETTEFCVDGPCPKFKTEKQIRAEAIKEFAERLRWYLASAFCYEDIYRNPQKETNRLIDNLVKEMTGEDHNGKPKQDS